MSLIIKNFLTKFQRYPFQISKFCTAIEKSTDNVNINNNLMSTSGVNMPIISDRTYLDEYKFYTKKRQIWIENIDTIESKKLGLMCLHPDIYAQRPRLDILYHNIRWQRVYRFVNFTHVKNRMELKGGGRKPWPQKGTGRARHGSTNSPLWFRGGKAHGPRSPKTHFYMPNYFHRVNGLAIALSFKFAQNDLFVVRDLEIPSKDPAYIESLMEERLWGPSLLLIDTEDIMPENITIATDTLKHVNMMPVYGLNVYSMMKHSTLVLTHRAARQIEDKLLHALHRPDGGAVQAKFQLSQA